MVTNVGIVDLGNSNILSISRAVEKTASAKSIVCKTSEQMKDVDKLVIPGVGAFPNGMKQVLELGLDQSIRDAHNRGINILGICLGMQILAEIGFEFEKCRGLNLVSGNVERLKQTAVNGDKLVIPFVGWAPLETVSRNHPILNDSFSKKSFYFVHSYQFIPKNENEIIATYSYGGNKIVAAIAKENTLGVQFHPEKSGPEGLRLIEKFIEGT